MPASEDGQSCASVITPDTGPLRWWTYMHEGSGCQGGGGEKGERRIVTALILRLYSTGLS